MWKVLVKFLGEWAIWRECKSRAEGRTELAYWRGRMNWPLKLRRDRGET